MTEDELLAEVLKRLDRIEAKAKGRPPIVPVLEPTLSEIARSIIRVESKVDLVTNDHETRLRRMERWMYAVPVTLVASAAAVAVALLEGAKP